MTTALTTTATDWLNTLVFYMNIARVPPPCNYKMNVISNLMHVLLEP